MAVKITYFVHSTTTDNEVHRATGWLPGELSKLGIQRAHQLTEQTADKSFDVVFTSDSKRAIDTGAIAFGEKYTIIQDERLRECNYGDMNGGPHEFKDNMHDFVDTPFPNGESYKDVEKRIACSVSEERIRRQTCSNRCSPRPAIGAGCCPKRQNMEPSH